jgi:hypothetical protein
MRRLRHLFDGQPPHIPLGEDGHVRFNAHTLKILVQAALDGLLTG